MIQAEWLIETLGEMIDDLDRARLVVRKYAAQAQVKQGGMLESGDAYRILEAIKVGEAGLLITAASTLKVRIMMLLTVKGQLTV